MSACGGLVNRSYKPNPSDAVKQLTASEQLRRGMAPATPFPPLWLAPQGAARTPPSARPGRQAVGWKQGISLPPAPFSLFGIPMPQALLLRPGYGPAKFQPNTPGRTLPHGQRHAGRQTLHRSTPSPAHDGISAAYLARDVSGPPLRPFLYPVLRSGPGWGSTCTPPSAHAAPPPSCGVLPAFLILTPLSTLLDSRQSHISCPDHRATRLASACAGRLSVGPNRSLPPYGGQDGPANDAGLGRLRALPGPPCARTPALRLRLEKSRSHYASFGCCAIFGRRGLVGRSRVSFLSEVSCGRSFFPCLGGFGAGLGSGGCLGGVRRSCVCGLACVGAGKSVPLVAWGASWGCVGSVPRVAVGFGRAAGSRGRRAVWCGGGCVGGAGSFGCCGSGGWVRAAGVLVRRGCVVSRVGRSFCGVVSLRVKRARRRGGLPSCVPGLARA